MYVQEKSIVTTRLSLLLPVKYYYSLAVKTKDRSQTFVRRRIPNSAFDFVEKRFASKIRKNESHNGFFKIRQCQSDE